MTLGMAEAVVNAVKTYLTANMSAKLAALDAEYADFALDTVKVYFVGEQRYEELVEAYPAFVILADETRVERWAPSFVDTSHTVAIGGVVLDPDSERLRRRLYRYARATWELLIEGHAAGQLSAFQMVDEPVELDFSPVEVEETDFIGSFRLTARLRKQEDK